ncbi:glycosyltransferase family 2 protein [Anthocerotibacter panamensis]|uniref:glycosyltransferase family 2 protein n=1 Tax=Anthocerotibacter panamensis TaxID=2857077 RepID=UPI001C403155|nr:glycosyltransferase [Anthocerotibacter panamensis]
MPKVSIIIPNYNYAHFLEERFSSILNQTYQDFEIIYLDDCSTDRSEEIVQKFSNDTRIRTIYNNSNSGSPFKQWNKGMRLAKGEYIWIAEADDYSENNFLQRLVPLLDNHPNVGIAYCQSLLVDEVGKELFSFTQWLSPRERWLSHYINPGADECSKYLIQQNTIVNASSVLLRRSVCEKVGYADESFRQCADWMFWVKMLEVSDIAYIADHLNYFRRHTKTTTNRSELSGILTEESYKVVKFICEHFEVPPEALNKVCSELLKRWVCILLSRDGKIPMARNLRIFQTALKVDKALLLGFIERIIYHLGLRVKRRLTFR